MSADNDPEPMEVDGPQTVPQPSPPTTSADEGAQAPVTSSQEEEDEVQVFASVQWLDGYQPQRCNFELSRVLQCWANTNNFKADIDVVNTSEDGNAEIKIKSASALKLLKTLCGRTLATREGNRVTVKSVSLTPPEMETEEPAAASINLSSSFASSVSNPQEAPVTSSQEDEVQVFVSVEWLDGYQPRKFNTELNRVLQSWANTNNFKVDCTVVEASKDGNAEIKIKPSSALNLLHNLWKKTLTTKDGKNKVTIKSVSLTPPEVKTQEPAAASMNLSSPSASASSSSLPDPQNEEVKLDKQSSSSSSGEERMTNQETCQLPVSHFLYVSHIYKEEMKRIEKESGVEIVAEVMVTFKPQSQKGGDPQKALSDFTTLVQKPLAELGSPIKYVDPEQWKETLRIIQKKENKLFVTLSSEEMIVCGPRQSQDFISKTLNTSEKTLTNNSMAESTWPSQDTPLKMRDMNIKDPLTAGLTVEENHWKLLMTSFTGKVDAIKEKFDVDLQISDVGQGKVDVRARYRKSGGHKSMESHAIRALLHLYQKITTSPLGHTPFLGASGFNSSMKNNDKQSEGASSGPVSNGRSGGDSEDNTCPICMDTFTNKKQLKCKHEFCEECLERAKKVSGSICPVCKDVFGKIEGDQPEGTMSWRTTPTSLPGFSKHGTIVIDYDIRSGIQTEKHPNPGKWFSGTQRTAYLPDNREGKDVLRLLERAFEQKLIFTVGASRTTGLENQVTWNDIHHKTNIHGGPQGFGYPDPDYLSRVRDELKAKGVK